MELSDYDKLYVGAKVNHSIYGSGVVTKVMGRPTRMGQSCYEADFAGGGKCCSLVYTISIEAVRFEPKPGDLVTWGSGQAIYTFAGELPDGRVVMLDGKRADGGNVYTNHETWIAPRASLTDFRVAKRKVKVKVEVDVFKEDGKYLATAASDQDPAGGFGTPEPGRVATRVIEFEIEE